MEYPPNLLWAFVVFCESDSIQKAATKMGLTQPALSKQLKSLQALMPHELFTYRGKKKVLTQFGADIYNEIKGRHKQIDLGVSSVCKRHSKPEERSIKVGARSEILERIVCRLNCVARLDYMPLEHQSIVDGVLEGKIDVGITHSVPDSFELRAKKLFKESFHIVAPKSLVNRSKTARLQDIPVITYRDSDSIMESAAKELMLDGAKLNVKRTCSDYRLIRNMVEQGLGWAILPVYIPFDPKKCIPFDLKGRTLPKKDFFWVTRKEFRPIESEIGLLDRVSTLF